MDFNEDVNIILPEGYVSTTELFEKVGQSLLKNHYTGESISFFWDIPSKKTLIEVLTFGYKVSYAFEHHSQWFSNNQFSIEEFKKTTCAIFLTYIQEIEKDNTWPEYFSEVMRNWEIFGKKNLILTAADIKKYSRLRNSFIKNEEQDDVVDVSLNKSSSIDILILGVIESLLTYFVIEKFIKKGIYSNKLTVNFMDKDTGKTTCLTREDIDKNFQRNLLFSLHSSIGTYETNQTHMGYINFKNNEVINLCSNLAGCTIRTSEYRSEYMNVMFAAIEEFKITRENQPKKDDSLVPWIKANADKYGISKISEKIADSMATIIRTQESAKKGRLSLKKKP